MNRVNNYRKTFKDFDSEGRFKGVYLSSYLTDEEKTKFAISAIKLRKGYNEEDKVEISQETIDELLSPVRKEDSANNLYNIYNIIQERIIKGNFHYSEKQKKMRKMRMVTSISKDLDINTNLFNLACSYVRVAA